jgi:hypothetical protein
VNTGSWLLRCYPRRWRERYGDDVRAYLEDTYPDRLPLRAGASLVVGGVRERARDAGGLGATSSADRVRGGALLVLVAWAAFVVAGSSFAKLSEHFEVSLPAGAHTVPDVAYTCLLAVAVLTAVAVAVGLLLAAPALLRFISGGGWPIIRGQVARAAAVTAVAVGTTAALSGWAHSLTAPQRNGRDLAYSAAFLGWAGLLVMTLGLWTVATVATARRLTLSRRVLLAESALATGIAAAMVAMVAAAAVWWAEMASDAPSFWRVGASGSTSAWNPQLIGTLSLMLLALSLAGVGVRIIAAAHVAGDTGRVDVSGGC